MHKVSQPVKCRAGPQCGPPLNAVHFTGVVALLLWPHAWAGPGSGQVTNPQIGVAFPPALKSQGFGGSHQSLEKLPVSDKAVKMAFSPPTLFLSCSGR